MTFSEYVDWALAQTAGIDVDGMYGPQCVDLADHYASNFIGAPLPPVVGAKDFAGLAIPGWTWVPITSDVPRRGDLVIFGTEIGPNGHVDICTHDDAAVNGYLGIDQNWVNASDNGSPPAVVQHDLAGVVGMQRPVNFPDTPPAPPATDTTENDDMPVQAWVLPPTYMTKDSKPIYVPDVNANLDDVFVSPCGCDEGDGQIQVNYTNGLDPQGTVMAAEVLSFTAKGDGPGFRLPSGVTRIVIDPPTAPCWVAVKVQKKS